MADNIAITAGSGTTVHADEYTHATLGAGKTQLVKLVDGTLDAGTAIAAGAGVAATSLRVNLATDVGLPAGTAAIGKVKVTNDAGAVIDPVAAGSAAMAASIPVTIATDDTVLGGNADAASVSTSIKAALRGIATATGITALDLGTGTGGSRTLRFFKDTAQWIGGAGAVTSAVQRMTLASDDPLVAAVKTEDVAFAGADKGIPAMIVQTAAPANTATDGDYAMLQADKGYLWVATPALQQVTATFNRPANTTAYTANDAVNDNATAGGGSSTLMSFTVAHGKGTVKRIRIRKSDQTVFTPTLRAWIYQATLTQTAGDNEAFTHPVADCISPIDVAVTNAGTDDAVGFTNCDIAFVSAALKMQLQTLSAFTPASGETFTVDLWYLPG